MKTTNIFYRALCLVLMALCSVCGFAQTAYEVHRPGIHAQQFLSSASTGTGLHTGQLTVDIPLFNLPGKGIDIPVALKFSAADVNNSTEASSVGLGWSLMAGGVITSIVNGADDLSETSRSDVPWLYQADYIESKYHEERTSPYSGIMDNALQLAGVKGQPDSYHYSFMGYSGDIDLSLDINDVRVCKLYPDTDFKLSETADGYTITDTEGIVYHFEAEATRSRYNANTITNSWFLSRITTPQGGTVTFSYEAESYIDLRNEFDAQYHSTINTKRLTRITSDYGSLVFNSEARGDLPGTEHISSIEQLDAEGNLIKGYKLNMGVSFENGNKADTRHYNTRMGLSSLQEYGSDRTLLPPTSFTYSYSFSRSKNTYNRYILPDGNNKRGSWAALPGFYTAVDRNHSGGPACWTSNPGSPLEYLNGYYGITDDYDGTVDDYFCLTQIVHPTGGYESFTYEKHDYSRVGSGNETVIPGSSVTGRRLKRHTRYDYLNNVEYTDYIYRLHSDDYTVASNALSSGVLVNPSIHTSVMYEFVNDDPNGNNRFVAVPYTTPKPQNSWQGVPVCYTEVEEVHSDVMNTILGRKIHYFDRVTAQPGTNFIYVNYDWGYEGPLITLQNTFYGTLNGYPESVSEYNTTYSTYMNYPLGDFFYPSSTTGKIRKLVSLNGYGEVVSKEEHEYIHGEAAHLYGYTVCRFDDSPSSTTNPRHYRFLLNRNIHSIVYSRLQRSTMTEYLHGGTGTDSIRTVHEYAYNGNRVLYEQQTTDNGTVMRREHVYPDMVPFDTNTSFSSQASALYRLVAGNAIGTPVQTLEKRNGIYTGGTYRTYGHHASTALVDSVFILRPGPSMGSVTTRVNSSGQVVRHGNFDFDHGFTNYTNAHHPQGYRFRTKPGAAVYRGYSDRCIVAVIEGCTYSQLQANTALKQQLALLETFNTGTESGRNALKACNTAIRSALPAGMMAVTYTWDPDRGITSETDASGDTTYFEYDSFGRLAAVRNTDWQVEENHEYHFKQ